MKEHVCDPPNNRSHVCGLAKAVEYVDNVVEFTAQRVRSPSPPELGRTRLVPVLVPERTKEPPVGVA